MKRMSVAVIMSLAAGAISSGFGGPGVGDPAPDFTEPDIYGTNHSLSDFAGKTVLLNFWTSW